MVKRNEERKKPCSKKMKQLKIQELVSGKQRLDHGIFATVENGCNNTMSNSDPVSNMDICYRSNTALGTMTGDDNDTSPSSAEEVREAARDIGLKAGPADLTGAPSTSGVQKKKKRVHRTKSKKQPSTDSDDSNNLKQQEKETRGKSMKVMRKGRVF